MHFRLKKTITHVTVLTALLPVAAFAAETTKIMRDPDLAPGRGQYVYDTMNGRVVRTTVIGDCVYTLYWTPESATPECNPNLFAKFKAPAPQPAAAAPQPAQAAPEPAQAAPQPAQAEPAAPVEYEAMEYAEATEHEAAPYEAPPAAAAEAPLEDFYAPGDAPDLVPVPPASEEVAADDRIGEPKMYYEEEVVAAEEEGIVGRSEYHEEEGVEPQEGIVGRREYYEEEEGVQQDDGIIGQSQYYEEEESVQQDDGIVGQSQYYEEEGAQQEEGIVARSEYYEEEGKQPEDLISEPTAPQEAAVAAAEQEQEAAPAVAAAEQEAAPAVAAAEQEQEAAPAVAAAEQEQEAAPAAVEQEAAPAAVEQEPTPIMLPVTITLEAEPWFDFDRYAVRSDARDKLNNLAGEMSGVEYDEILVVGHADRIGTPQYNQVLSERRARSVKNYLVGKGVPAERIKTEGRGEFEPALDPAFCKGMRSQKLISCLQPDRRVEVTVTGTKLQK